jgi:hypothetical protein
MVADAVAAVATLEPVGPAELSTTSATSVRSLVAETISPRSVMPAGGAIVESALMPNAPTIIVPAKAEVTEGAVIEVVVPVPALKVSTGLVVAAPR